VDPRQQADRLAVGSAEAEAVTGPQRLVTPCESSACIALERHPTDSQFLILANSENWTVVVTAAEVRAFAEAVVDGHFDPLLGDREA
jgi:hypothetical protein